MHAHWQAQTAQAQRSAAQHCTAQRGAPPGVKERKAASTSASVWKRPGCRHDDLARVAQALPIIPKNLG